MVLVTGAQNFVVVSRSGRHLRRLLGVTLIRPLYRRLGSRSIFTAGPVWRVGPGTVRRTKRGSEVSWLVGAGVCTASRTVPRGARASPSVWTQDPRQASSSSALRRVSPHPYHHSVPLLRPDPTVRGPFVCSTPGATLTSSVGVTSGAFSLRGGTVLKVLVTSRTVPSAGPVYTSGTTVCPRRGTGPPGVSVILWLAFWSSGRVVVPQNGKRNTLVSGVFGPVSGGVCTVCFRARARVRPCPHTWRLVRTRVSRRSPARTPPARDHKRRKRSPPWTSPVTTGGGPRRKTAPVVVGVTSRLSGAVRVHTTVGTPCATGLTPKGSVVTTTLDTTGLSHWMLRKQRPRTFTF